MAFWVSSVVPGIWRTSGGAPGPLCVAVLVALPAAEFAEAFGEQRRERSGVAARGVLQELLFEVEEVCGEFLRAIDHGFGG